MQCTYGGNTYNIGNLDAFTQLHIARRLAPCVGKLATLLDADVKPRFDGAGKLEGWDGDMGQVIIPLMQAVRDMPDEDAEYICNACLEVTERKQAKGGFAPVRVNGQTMYPLSLPEMLVIAYHALARDVAGFFSGLPSDFDPGRLTAFLGSRSRAEKTGS